MGAPIAELKRIVKKGWCTRCFDCCSSPPLVTKDEAIRIARRLGLTLKQFIDSYLDKSQKWKMYYLNRADGHCVFFFNGKKIKSCGIYNIRPWECRMMICGLGKRNASKAHAIVSGYIKAHEQDYTWRRILRRRYKHKSE